MGIIYLAALILGLGTLTLQFVLSHLGGGADAHGDADADDLHLEADAGDIHLDAGADELDIEADHELELGDHGEIDHEVDAGSDADSLVGSAAGLFLSMRFWTFALMAFGMVGTLLHYLQLSGFGVGLTLSILSGLASGLAAAFTFRALKEGVSSTTSQADTVGRMAKVTVPLRKGGLGKVRIELKGKMVDMLAVTDAAEVNTGDEVVVVEFRDDKVCVEPLTRDGNKDA